MKPFVINRNSWHYKINKYVLNDNGYSSGMKYCWEPKHNNFCAYWRATILRLFFIALMSILSIFIMIMIGSAIYQYPIQSLFTISGVIGVFGILYLSFILSEKIKERKKDAPESLLAQKYRVHKSKICPMVEYKE